MAGQLWRRLPSPGCRARRSIRKPSRLGAVPSSNSQAFVGVEETEIVGRAHDAARTTADEAKHIPVQIVGTEVKREMPGRGSASFDGRRGLPLDGRPRGRAGPPHHWQCAPVDPGLSARPLGVASSQPKIRACLQMRGAARYFDPDEGRKNQLVVETNTSSGLMASDENENDASFGDGRQQPMPPRQPQPDRRAGPASRWRGRRAPGPRCHLSAPSTSTLRPSLLTAMSPVLSR